MNIAAALLLEQVKAMGKGEQDTLDRLTRAGIQIDWKARLRLERQLLRKLHSLYAQFWGKISGEMLSQLKVIGESIVYEAMSAIEKFEIQLRKLTSAFTKKGFELGAQDAVRGLNAAIGLDVVHVRGLDTLRARADSLAAWLTDRTAKTVTRTMVMTIEQGMAEGWSIRKMQEELKSKGETTLGRAETIARTTVVKSYNLGRIVELTEIGVEELELVGCSPDCEECQGVIAENPYPVAEAEAIETDLHPNHTGSWVPTKASIGKLL